MGQIRRQGFTLIELLVVIAIIGMLMGLLLSAVQRVRDVAARAKCANNIRQLGLAAHQFHNDRGAFPPGMEFQSSGSHAMMSWLTQLLPYVEQGSLWDKTQQAYQQSASPFNNPPHVGLATVTPLLGCPADPRTSQPHVPALNNYPVALTSYLGVEGKDLTTLDGVLFRDSHVRIEEITDGTSQTLLAGERPPSTDFQFGWWYAGAGQKFTGSGDMILGVEEQNVLPVTAGSCAPGVYTYEAGNVNNQCDMFHFWSPHIGGANFLFCDGSVHFLAYSAAPILPALASRNGSEVVDLP